MVIRAHAPDGTPIQVSFPPWFSWLAGILATVITATVISTAAKLVDMDTRVVRIESTRFTPEDAREYVTYREYDAVMLSVQSQLSRIEGKIDRLQEGR